MALSNWLTRNEWNACFFAGKKKVLEGSPCEGLGDLLHYGIAELHNAGYTFTGIVSYPNGDYEKVTQCCTGNESILVEFMDGTFNEYERAVETLNWAPTHLPGYDFSWLDDAVRAADDAEV